MDDLTRRRFVTTLASLPLASLLPAYALHYGIWWPVAPLTNQLIWTDNRG